MRYIFLVLFLLLAEIGTARTCISHLLGFKSVYSQALDLKEAILNKSDIQSVPLVQESLFNLKNDVSEIAREGQHRFLIKKAKEIKKRLDAKQISFEEYADLAHQSIALFELVNQINQKNLYRSMEDGFDTNLHLVMKSAQTDLFEKAKKGIIYLPLHKELSFEDMNHLWVNGIRPLGIISRPASADLSLRSPLSFYNHDVSHAISSGHHFMATDPIKSLYYKIKKDIENEDPIVKEAVERIIFYSIHEQAKALQNKKELVHTLAIGMDSQFISIKKITRKQIRELAQFMVPYKTGFVRSIDFIRDPEGKITAVQWEKALLYLNK